MCPDLSDPARLLLGVAFAVTLVAGQARAATAGSPDAFASSASVAGDWQPFSRAETLKDGSVLTEYVVRTSAFSGLPARLEISFSPRFGCDPMVGFTLEGPLALGSADEGGLDVRIDGVEVDWPMRPDDDAAEPRRRGWLYADRQQRRTVRLRIDAGDLIAVRRADGTTIPFSLLGSRDGMANAQQACRSHEPIPYEAL